MSFSLSLYFPLSFQDECLDRQNVWNLNSIKTFVSRAVDSFTFSRLCDMNCEGRPDPGDAGWGAGGVRRKACVSNKPFHFPVIGLACCCFRLWRPWNCLGLLHQAEGRRSQAGPRQTSRHWYLHLQLDGSNSTCEHLPAYGFCSISYFGSSENDDDEEDDDAFKREGGVICFDWQLSPPHGWVGQICGC